MTPRAFPLALGLLTALALATPAPAQDAEQMEEARQISRLLLEAPEGVDEAFGAYQRGYYLTALELALPRAENDDPAAQTLVAEIYANGLGVAENLPLAVEWYERAHNGGDIQATFQLAMLYQSGRGVTRDRERAAALFNAAAEGGHVAARYNMGLLHIEGRYAEPNLVRAAELIGEAAEAGYPEAQYDFAVMLLEGAGIAPDPVRAATLMQAAAEQRLLDAQVEWATMLYLGQGTARDLEAAAHWYGQAAEGGNAVAQSRYATLLAAGEGVEADPESAAMWRALARRQGLYPEQLDALLAGVAPEVIARGEERARFWPEEPPDGTAPTLIILNPVQPVSPDPDIGSEPMPIARPESGPASGGDADAS